MQRWWVERTSTTARFAPVVVALGFVVAWSNSSSVDPYWLDVSSKSTISMLFLAPGFAALAAWDAARWRRLAAVATRSWAELLLRSLAMAVGVTGLSFVVTLALLAASNHPEAGSPRSDVVGVAVLCVAALTAVGFLLGRCLPAVAAAPTAFGLVWLWVAYTPAVQPFWIRNVTGNLGTSCCAVDAELAPNALLAPALVAVSLVAVSIVLVGAPRSIPARTLCALVLAGAISVAATMVADLGPDPVRPRSGTQVCTSRDELTFCAWPEHRSRLGRAAPVLARTIRRLEAAGLDVPERLEENVKGRGGWSFSLVAIDVDTWRTVLAASPLSDLPPPCTDQTQGVWPAGVYFDLAVAWLNTVAGASAGAAAEAQEIDPEPLQALLRQPRARQRMWFERVERAMRTCDPVR